MVAFADNAETSFLSPATRARGQRSCVGLTSSYCTKPLEASDLEHRTDRERIHLGSCSRDPIGYVDGDSLYASYFVLHRMDPTGTEIGTHRVNGFMRFGSWSNDGYFSEDKMEYTFALDVGCDADGEPHMGNPRVESDNYVWAWDSPGYNQKLPFGLSIGFQLKHSVEPYLMVKGYECDGQTGGGLVGSLKLCWEITYELGAVVDWEWKRVLYCTYVKHDVSCCCNEEGVFEEVYKWEVTGCKPTKIGEIFMVGSRSWIHGAEYGGVACGDAYGGESRPRRTPGPYGPRR